MFKCAWPLLPFGAGLGGVVIGMAAGLGVSRLAPKCVIVLPAEVWRVERPLLSAGMRPTMWRRPVARPERAFRQNPGLLDRDRACRPHPRLRYNCDRSRTR
jgi:hypothetical protein